jgi:glycosyltransferase involved in cell wall biosynthesis
VHLSFEGPDPYAHAGGLAVRVSALTRAFARAGHPVDLYFVGDPHAPGVERRDGVELHRWSQAISAQARGGVYDDVERKIEDWCVWLPDHLARVVREDADCGRRTVILAEDWHTAWPLVAVHDELERRGLRQFATLAWTANNRFGFDRIDFGRLGAACSLLTISRAMKHLMWQYGVNPKVVPNGLDAAWIAPPPRAGISRLRDVLGDRLVLAKVGRWDPDKRWSMAIDAAAQLQQRGRPAVLVARGWNGSPEASAHHRELREHARRLGLPWIVCEHADELSAVVAAELPTVGILELAFPVEGDALRALYGAADAVLANSGFEPFGLVGLEAMATGAIVITGSTGEDYVRPFRNGFALDTDDAGEIVRVLEWLERQAGRDAAMRGAAVETAAQYLWSDIIERLLLALDLDA